jgi:hypothetical protein
MDKMAQKKGLKKQCSQCKTDKPFSEFYHKERSRDGYYGQCVKCVLGNLKEYRKGRGKIINSISHRKSNKVYARKNPEKIQAHNTLNHARQRGEILRLPCGVPGCNNPTSEAHHEDYSKPLDVDWMCRKHHLEHHNNLLIGE